MTDARAQVGRAGEAAAAEHFLGLGYRVLDRNWQCLPIGELDLVVSLGPVLVFVEVRSVTTRYLASPTLTVQPAKQQRVARAADRYLRSYRGRWDSVRFDLVGVELKFGRVLRLEHIENAFVPEWAF